MIAADWKPSDSDVKWLQKLLKVLKPGGVWMTPSGGVVFQKTGKKELTVIGLFTDDIEASKDMVELNQRVGAIAGIEIKNVDTVEVMALVSGSVDPDDNPIVAQFIEAKVEEWRKLHQEPDNTWLSR